MSRDDLLNNGSALPFSPKKQEAVLGHLLTDPQFFLLCKDRIKPEWFNYDPSCARVWTELQKFWEKTKRFPRSTEEFLEGSEIAFEDQKTKNRLHRQVAICLTEMGIHGIDTIRPLLQEWLQTHIYARLITESSKQYNNKDFKRALDVMRDGWRELEAAKFTDDEEYDFTNWVEHIKESQAELDNALTFGIDLVDKLLTPEAKNGGLLKGDTTVLLAPTNIGKTTTMVTVLVHNICAGKDVLFMTHEGRPADIRNKILQSMVGCTYQDLLHAHADPTSPRFRHIQTAARILKERVVWVPLMKAGYTVEELDSVIRRKYEERRSKTGKGFDMIVDDYPAKLTTKLAAKGNMPKRHIDDVVYNYFVQWALEFNSHSLVAIQGNRESSKANRGMKAHEHRLLTMEDVSEAFGPMQTATNVITINRDEIARMKGRITFYLCKGRGNETGFAVVCNSKYAHARTHATTLGGIWYRGSSTMSDRVDDLLSQYRGKEVPVAEILKPAA